MYYVFGKLFIAEPLGTATLIPCSVTRDTRAVIATATAEDETLKRLAKSSMMDYY